MKKLAVYLLLLTFLPAAAQTDNFNDGNDAGWVRFAPLAPLGVTAFTFPNGAYRLTCNPSPNPGTFGPARLASLRQEVVYSEFVVCVDFTGWDVTSDTSMGILARIQPNPSAGNVSGYALTYQANDRDLEINRVASEVGTSISSRIAISLEPAKSYRLVFLGIGSHLEGRIFDRDFPLVPLATVTANDGTYAAGTNGLLIFTELNTAIGATFDNYRADAGAAPPLIINPLAAGGVKVAWNTELGLPWRLESTGSLLAWSPEAPDLLENGTTQALLSPTDLSLNPVQYFRLAKGTVVP